MSQPNLNIILQAIVSVQNNLASNAPQIATYDFGNPTLAGTSFLFDPYILALTSGTVVQLPAPVVYFIAIQNLSPSQFLQVAIIPNGGVPNNVSYGPGGGCIFFDPLETGTGFSFIQLFGVGISTPAMVLVGY